MIHGIELCDANIQAARYDGEEPHLIRLAGSGDTSSCAGFALHEGGEYAFGQAAENAWFVQPRKVVHTFWSKLNHDATTLVVPPRSPSNSEVAYFFLRDFTARLAQSSPGAKQVVLAVPGVYLKDMTTEEEKIGLLLGMAADLKLPLSGVVDMATAALCDPRGPRFNPARPVLLLDLHLHAAELSLVVSADKLERRAFLHIPQSGVLELLKHLTSTMANRFLRQTSFDVMEDGRIEQVFYNQTKAFLTSEDPDFRYILNTTRRGYEMAVKRELLVADCQAFAENLVQTLLKFVQNHGLTPGLCAVALTERTVWLRQIENRLRSAGFVRFLRLPAGAAAAGAANIGSRLTPPSDLGDVPILKSLPSDLSRNRMSQRWEVHLQKGKRHATPDLKPTHALMDGLGRTLTGRVRFTIGAQGLAADLPLPDEFNHATDCTIALQLEGRSWWFTEPIPAENGQHPRIEIECGDRLQFRCGDSSSDILFAHCPHAPSNGAG
ncbi:MAG: hypothetical protein JNN01_03295 [Opitutaceae bacterium]|nr:hypothetical protein [Opitutaceae bacterium]